MKAKDIVLTIMFIWFATIAVVTLFGEPTPNGIWDSVLGFIFIKFISIAHIILCAKVWRRTSKEFRIKVENFFNK